MRNSSTDLGEELYCEHNFHIIVNYVIYAILSFNSKTHSSNGELKVEIKLSQILSNLG